jgi:hypothetical protein
VVKELSTQLGQGISGVFLNWSPYALLFSGAASMFLASNAFQAGSLAASQPGLTLVDPLVASALGVVLFGDRLNLHAGPASGEVLALFVVVLSVILLSRSPLVQDVKDPGTEGSSSTGSRVDALPLRVQAEPTAVRPVAESYRSDGRPARPHAAWLASNAGLTEPS